MKPKMKPKMEPKFSVGEKVRVRPDLGQCDDQHEHCGFGLNGDMMTLAGQIVEIIRCEFSGSVRKGKSDGHEYSIKEDYGRWVWTADCFVKIEPDIDPVSLLELL